MTERARAYLERQRQEIIDRCTACGDCFRACPIIALTPLKEATPEEVVTGVVGILRGGTPAGDATNWALACTRCGRCIEACPEGVNPRKMLALAEGLAQEAMGSRAGSQFFRLMSRNIHLLSGLQLARQDLIDIQGPPQAPTDVVFFLGCNLLGTPHIILNVMDLLSALGVDYRLAGGTGYCCGVVHFIGGELDAAEQITTTLFSKLAAFQPKTVLTWCPTCEMHLAETVAGSQRHDFELQHLTDFLVTHLDALKDRMSTPVRRRVALHAHAGLPRITRNVKLLLNAVPELETVGLEDGGELGYSCNVGGLLRLPALQEEVQARVWQQARSAGADEVVDLYHGCHRLLWDGKDGLPVRNFTDVLVEALGLPGHEDRYQRYRAMSGAEQVLAAAQDFVRENAIEPAVVEQAFPGLFQR